MRMSYAYNVIWSCPMRAATPTTRFARRQADRLLTDLRGKLARTAQSANPTAVHDLRVAIRRFLQVLAVFKAAFPAHQSKKIHRKLKRVMDPAGELRNCDIAAILIPRLDPKSAPQLRGKIQGARKSAERKLTQSLRRLVDRRLPAKWRAGLDLDSTHNGSGRREIPQAEQHIVKEMATEFLKLGKKAASPETSAQQVHRFRIASKKFRYTLELFEPFHGAELTPWLERVKAVQSVLGDANDCETVRRMVSRWNAGEKLVAKLDERQNRKLRKFRREWEALPGPGAFPAVVPVKPVVKVGGRRRGAASSSSRSATSQSAVA
jgi:CHAD domain-containing protein